MNKEDFLFLIGDEPGTDEAFVDSFLTNRTPPEPAEVTATGNPLIIRTSEAQNADATLISFVPKQAGEGTPSPENIRPISGYSALTLTVNGTDVTINLGDTYYGGNVDIENGTATITHSLITFIGGDAWNYSESAGKRRVFVPLYGAKSNSVDLWGNIAKGASEVIGYPNHWEMCLNANATPSLVIGVDNTISSKDDWNALLASMNMVVAYPLATPQTITLTAQTVALLKGYNRLSTDGDKITITYTGYPVVIPNLNRLEGRLTLDENLGLSDQESSDDVLSQE